METHSPQEIIKNEQEKEAAKLLAALVNLQDSLLLVAEGTDKQRALEERSKEESPEISSLRYATDSLIGFSDFPISSVVIRPRAIREKDREKILPGQHAGVFLQFNLEDGTILRINFFGALRSIDTTDLKDGNANFSLGRSHTSRTEEIIGQTTQLNWQVSYPNGPTIDSWVVYSPNNNGSFRQSILKMEGESIDIHPNLQNTDPYFKSIKEEIFTPIGQLAKLVPSSV